jgi:D-glycero-D-manno-heptose 1,7-bisphosphate phosphatase
MIEQILEKYTIDLTSSWMIGDKQSDIDLAHNANIMHTVAIGERDIRNATLSFKTIAKAQRYLEENQDKIA